MNDHASAAEIIRRAAQANPHVADPKELVPLVLADLAGREEEMLQRLLPSYIAQVLRRGSPTTEGVEGWESFMGERIPTENGYVFARDATADDLEAGQTRRKRFAGALDGRAHLFGATASAMRANRVERAGELTIEMARDVISDLALRSRMLQSERLTLEARIRRLGTLSASVQRLRELVASGTDPREEHLRSYRDALLTERAKLVDSIERGRLTDRLHAEALSGTR